MVFDYGNQLPIVPTTVPIQCPTVNLFSCKSDVLSDCFSRKDQAIVIEAKDGIQIKDYAFVIDKITNPRNIRFIWGISSGVICVFLATGELAK